MKSTFGETSLAASTPNPDALAAFAVQRSSDGALTVMVINKYLSGSTPATINLANFAHAEAAQVWQLTAANTITRLPDISVSGPSLGATLPPQSITMFVVALNAGAIPPRAPANLRIV